MGRRGNEVKDKDNNTYNMDKGFNVRDYLETSLMTENMIDYCEFWVTANAIVRRSGTHNFCKERIQVNTDLNFDYLNEALQDYEDKRIIDFLKFGFPLNAIDTEVNEDIPPNQEGARKNPADLDKYIADELKMGSIIGPFKKSPFGKVTRVHCWIVGTKRIQVKKELSLIFPTLMLGAQ